MKSSVSDSSASGRNAPSTRSPGSTLGELSRLLSENDGALVVTASVASTVPLVLACLGLVTAIHGRLVLGGGVAAAAYLVALVSFVSLHRVVARRAVAGAAARTEREQETSKHVVLAPVGAAPIRDVAVVSERAPIFAMSLRENIAAGDRFASLDAVIAASRAAGLHDDVMQMPLGYDTPLTSGGSSLSPVQRRRIALARALLRRPSVLLLEEGADEFDSSSKIRIKANLAELGCTCIVTDAPTHRDTRQAQPLFAGKLPTPRYERTAARSRFGSAAVAATLACMR